jgi:poly-gamma-glutamate synthesis protein (capsule biosynthesis protein)
MGSINLLFSGDFAPLVMPDQISECHFKGLEEIISSTDLHITNLECSITTSEKRIEKPGPVLKVAPQAIDLLKQAHVGVVCLANNHIFDYGEEGINETITSCEKNGIDTIGIVERKDKRDHWLIRELKDKKIGFLNYCEHEFSVRARGLLGASGYDPITAYNDILSLRQEVDWLIVIYHGGNEYYPLPRPDLKRDFHFMADVGADAVIGHHTHVFSGIELYNGKPLVYSLGNFFFPEEEEPEGWNEGIICRLIINDSANAELVPIQQCKEDLVVEKLTGEKRAEILSEISKLSDIIANDEKLQKRWENHVVQAGRGLTNQILYPTKADKLLLRVPWLMSFVNNACRVRSLINILRCRSLEQLLIYNLKSRQ